MAIVNKAKETDKVETKKLTYTCVLSKVPIRVIGNQKYALVVPDKAALEILDKAPTTVTVKDGVVLFRLSKFCRAAVEGIETDVAEVAVKGIANIKLRHALFDWKYGSKKGTTDTLEVIGMNIIKSQPISSALAGLEFEGDADDVDLDDLPF